jgi:hypothetical protein
MGVRGCLATGAASCGFRSQIAFGVGAAADGAEHGRGEGVVDRTGGFHEVVEHVVRSLLSVWLHVEPHQASMGLSSGLNSARYRTVMVSGTINALVLCFPARHAMRF